MTYFQSQIPHHWLIYPWGNVWDGSRALWSGNSNGQTANVGSFPSGVSWVGATDMGGNVWEWVSSLYLPYPYDTSHENNNDNSNLRAIHGGGFDNIERVLRTSDRYGVPPSDVGMGFRCAR